MGKAARIRDQRRSARAKRRAVKRRERVRAPEPAQDLGGDLFRGINQAIAGVVARYRTPDGVPDPAVIAQALCLILANLALVEGVPRQKVVEIISTYMDQAEQVLGMMQGQQPEPESRIILP